MDIGTIVILGLLAVLVGIAILAAINKWQARSTCKKFPLQDIPESKIPAATRMMVEQRQMWIAEKRKNQVAATVLSSILFLAKEERPSEEFNQKIASLAAEALDAIQEK